jgi:hypothetical protein
MLRQGRRAGDLAGGGGKTRRRRRCGKVDERVTWLVAAA